MRQKILFICTNNSARSQIAEGIMNYFYKDKFKAYSGDIKPTAINPYLIQVMKEIGIDISNQYSKDIEKFRNKRFDIVITVCDNAKENCPFFPGKK